MPLILVTLLLSETKFLFLDSDTTHTTVKIVHRGITACVIKTSVFVNLVIRERKAQRGYFQHPQTNLYYSAKHKSVARSATLITQRSIKLLTKRRKPLILVLVGPHWAERTQNWNPCGCGGIGRRAGFRCLCPSGRGGSTPLIRIMAS